MDTIFALASARGVSGVAVIRVSGTHAQDICTRLCGDLPSSRGLRKLKDGDGELLDEALVLVFSGTSSFTGEPVVELHTHGSPAVISSVLNALSTFANARQAEPGEFTKRALENGKLNLAEVEGLADLIDAETEAQRKQAIRVFDGELGEKANAWRKKLVRASALIEATIDFADEEVPVDVYPEVGELLKTVFDDLKAEEEGVPFAERLRDGFEVAIVGKPNVGKSTLLNRLAGREAAITSNIAGTTRDVIEVKMDIAGIPVTLIDTAGVRQSVDQIEKLGIELAKKRANEADVRVFLLENNELPEIGVQEDDLIFSAKADVNSGSGPALSGKTGQGIDNLINKLDEILSQRVARVGVAMRERHRAAIVRAMGHLEEVENLISNAAEADIVAAELRLAVRAVDSIVGRVDVEDLLDEIFASFCIGK